MTTKDPASEREEIELLLPWYAAGTLSRDDASRVEAALARDSVLAQRYEDIRAERAEAVSLNESLGAPSVGAMQRLFTAIDADPARKSKPRSRFDIAGWLADALTQFSPRTLAWGAAAALALIALQASLLTGIYFTDGNGLFGTAGEYRTATINPGTFAYIRFNPAATAGEIDRFLQSHNASVVAGPMPRGIYRVRVSAIDLPQDELAKVMNRMEQEKAIVGFIAPAE